MVFFQTIKNAHKFAISLPFFSGKWLTVDPDSRAGGARSDCYSENLALQAALIQNKWLLGARRRSRLAPP